MPVKTKGHLRGSEGIFDEQKSLSSGFGKPVAKADFCESIKGNREKHVPK
jgi:hypothetical protein